MTEKIEKTDAELIHEADELRQKWENRFQPKDLGNGLAIEYVEGSKPGTVVAQLVRKEA